MVESEIRERLLVNCPTCKSKINNPAKEGFIVCDTCGCIWFVRI